MNYATLDLLRSDHAPLLASFLHRVFVAPNVRFMAQADLVEALEDELFGLRERLGPSAFPKSALEYLDDWATNDRHGLAAGGTRQIAAGGLTRPLGCGSPASRP